MQKKTFIFSLVALMVLAFLALLSASRFVKPIEEIVLAAARPALHVSERLRAAIIPTTPLDTWAQPDTRIQETFRAKLLQEENERLRRALQLKEKTVLPLKGFSVLLDGRESDKEFLLLDGGEQNGVSAGAPALDENGFLIGVVRESTNRFAKVSLASNPGEVHEVEIIPGSIRALAKGIGNHTFLLDLIPSAVPLRQGDFVTLARPRAAPPILVGTIVRIENNTSAAFQTVYAVALAKPQNAHEVFILPAETPP